MMRVLAMLALVAACGGETGTIQLGFATAPGSPLLESVQRLRVTLTAPRQVVEAERSDGGFDLVLDVKAFGGAGSVIVEGFDAVDQLVATGMSPPFPVAAINARIVVYLAPPMSIELAPEQLPAIRIHNATTPLSYGIAIVGGLGPDVVATTDMFVYNSYDHTLVAGAPLPSPRAQMAVATGGGDTVYIVGGVDADFAATGTVFRFDTTVAPSGRYDELTARPEFARNEERAIPLGLERHIITGSPVLEMNFGSLTPRDDIDRVFPYGASATDEGVTYALFVGDPIIRITDDTAESLATSLSNFATPAALPDGRIVFASPDLTRDLLIIDASGQASRVADALSVVRNQAAVAATARHLVVASGFVDDMTHASADILDATTFELVATIPCLPRIGAFATPFLNDQIIIVGGAPANDVIELFTPPPP